MAESYSDWGDYMNFADDITYLKDRYDRLTKFVGDFNSIRNTIGKSNRDNINISIDPEDAVVDPQRYPIGLTWRININKDDLMELLKFLDDKRIETAKKLHDCIDDRYNQSTKKS